MKKNKVIVFLLMIIVIAVGIAMVLMWLVNHANTINSKNSTSKLEVIASFYPLYFFASKVGGERAHVVNLTPAGVEPHDYEPTTQDIAHISNADMLIVNGGKFEAWEEKTREQLNGTNIVIVTSGEKLANKQLNEEGKIIADPHIWQDPILVKEVIANIEKGFEKLDPKNTFYFQANEKKLNGQIDQLHSDFKKGLSDCKKKDFVTSHAAFGYLAARYGINQVAINGISPDQEPSSQKLAEVANLVKKENIKIVFFESLVSPKLSQTIAQETGAKVMVLDPIEGLSEKDLHAGKNYITVMRSNLAALQIALQCTK